MADAFSNQFLVSVKVSELNQVTELYESLSRLKAIAAEAFPEIVIPVAGATSGLATLKKDLKATAAEASKTEKAIDKIKKVTAGAIDTTGVITSLGAITAEANKAVKATAELLTNIRAATRGRGSRTDPGSAGYTPAPITPKLGVAVSETNAIVTNIESAIAETGVLSASWSPLIAKLSAAKAQTDQLAQSMRGVSDFAVRIDQTPRYNPNAATPPSALDTARFGTEANRRLAVAQAREVQAPPPAFDVSRFSPSRPEEIARRLATSQIPVVPVKSAVDFAGLGTTQERLLAASQIYSRDQRAALDAVARHRVELNNEIQKSEGLFNSFLYKFRSLALYAVSGAVIFGAINAVRTGVGETIKLESELAKIQGFFDDKSLNSRLLIERGTIQAAIDYGAALTDVVRTAKLFAQAGFSPEQSIAQTRASLAASTALGITPEAAAQTAISVKEVSGGQVSSRDIFERIARTDARNAVNADDLNTAVQRIGAFAEQLQPRAKGVVDAFDLIIGATTQIVETTRVSGGQASNALKFIIARLANPDVAGQLQGKFGIKLASNPEGTQFRPLIEILQDVASKYKQLKEGGTSGGSIQAQQLLSTIAGSRQIGLATALFDNFSKAMETAKDSSNAYGELQTRLNLQLDTVSKQAERFKTSFIAATNALFEQGQFLTGTKAVLRGGTSLLEKTAESPGGPGLALLALTTGAAGLFKGAKAINTYVAEVRATARLAGLATVTAEGLGAAPGLSKFGAIAAGIAEIFGPLTPLAVLAGLAALAGVVTYFLTNRTPHLDISTPTYSEIDKTDFGKELATTTELLGTTNRGLVRNILRARDSATADIIALGEQEAKVPGDRRNKNLAQFASPEYTQSVLENRTLNAAFPARYTELFAQHLLEQFSKLNPEAITQLTGSPLGPKITDQQVSFAQGLLKYTKQYEGAPTTVTAQDKFTKLTDAIGKLDEVEAAAALARKNTGGGYEGGALPDTRPALQSVLNDAFGQFAPTLTGLKGLLVSASSGPHGTVNALSEIDKYALDQTKSWAQILDKFFEKYFTTTTGTPVDIVQQNQANYRAGVVAPAIFDYTKGKAGTAPQDSLTTDGVGNLAPGVLTGRIILAQVKAYINEQFTQGLSTTSPLGQQLTGLIKAISQDGEAFAGKIGGAVDVLATTKDRIAQIITDFAKKMLEIEAVGPVFKSVGLAFDDTAERLSAAKGLLRGLAGAPAEIQGQITALQLSYGQVNALTSGNSSAAEIVKELSDQQSSNTTEDPLASPLAGLAQSIKLTNGQKRLEAIQTQIGQLKATLRDFLGGAPLLKYAGAEQRTALLQVFKDISDNKATEITYTQLQELSKGIVTNILDAAAAELIMRQNALNVYTTLQRELSLRSKLADLTESLATSQGELASGNKIGGVGPRLQTIDRHRIEEEERARLQYRKVLTANQQAFDSGEKDYDKFQAALSQAKFDLEEAVTSAYDTATVDMQRLLQEERQSIQADTVNSTRALIESGTSGFKEAFKNTDLLFGRGRDLRFRDLARTALTPVGTTIQGNVVDNLFEQLTGPKGLITGPLAALFGQNQKQREQLQLKELQYEATRDGVYDGTTQALRDAGVGGGPSLTPATPPGLQVLFKGIGGLSGIAGITGAVRALTSSTGLPAILKGSGVNSNILLGGRSFYGPNRNIGGNNNTLLGSILPTSGIPSILQGGRSPTGPNVGPGLDKLNLADARKARAKQLAIQLAGIYGGTLLGGAVSGKGANSYSDLGASLGSVVGGISALGLGPLGPLIGGLVGGIFGGLFGKGRPPQPPRQPQILERIERNTRQTATAIENQNRQLFTLDSRLLNVPSSFNVSKYRPDAANGGSVVNQNQYQFNITSNDPQAVARAVEKVVRGDQRLQGSNIPLRFGA